jgi:hypothetical protein
MLTTLLTEFNGEVRQLYSAEDRLRGHMVSLDRDGVERQLPLMRCSIGVLEIPEGLIISDLNRISAEIAHVKSRAKKSEGGMSFVELSETIASA